MGVGLFSSLAELLAGAGERRPLEADGKSGAVVERVEVGGRPHVLKRQRGRDDWIMRALGDEVFWAWELWASGALEELPTSIDPAVVGMARYDNGAEPELAILMEDVGPWLVPDGDTVLPADAQSGFLTSMAGLHAAYLSVEIDASLLEMPARIRFFAPDNLAQFDGDAALPVPVALARDGWERLDELAPETARVLGAVHEEVSPLSEALGATPSTLLHGDWKLANLGRRPDGRTILLDWALPGTGPPCWEVAWYLALNRARLPTSKEAVMASYRDALEAAGVPTADWWEAQMGLSLLGVAAVFGWEKALGDPEELAWWVTAVDDARHWLP